MERQFDERKGAWGKREKKRFSSFLHLMYHELTKSFPSITTYTENRLGTSLCLTKLTSTWTAELPVRRTEKPGGNP